MTGSRGLSLRPAGLPHEAGCRQPILNAACPRESPGRHDRQPGLSAAPAGLVFTGCAVAARLSYHRGAARDVPRRPLGGPGGVYFVTWGAEGPRTRHGQAGYSSGGDRGERGRSRTAATIAGLAMNSESETAFPALRAGPDAGAARHRPWCKHRARPGTPGPVRGRRRPTSRPRPGTFTEP
jgi:hypothetical protein